MKVELVGFNENFNVDVELDKDKRIIHILDLATVGSTSSLVNVFDINNNQNRIIKKFNLNDGTEWGWKLYSPWDNSVYNFNKGELIKVNGRDVYSPFYERISIKKNLGYYITKLTIENLRHIDNALIELTEQERKHLIITGRNGSGKTSFLNALKSYLYSIETDKFNSIEDWQILLEKKRVVLKNSENITENMDEVYRQIEQLEQLIGNYFKGVKPTFNTKVNIINEYKKGNFIVAFFDAKRAVKMIEPDAIRKIESKVSYNIDANPSNVFVQFLVNLKAEQAFANQEGDSKTVNKISTWFEHLEMNLQNLFESKSLKINFDFKTLNMYFTEDNKSKYSFNTLSDGFSSVINIVSELILRMENKVKVETSYEVAGIVLIDEIETHLHVSLQKKILPFLINLFPNIQFIVSTHSPFVLNSVSNAIIYDLENKLRIDDLSGLSYEGIVESYFYNSQYGEELEKRLERLEFLLLKNEKNDDERIELLDLKSYFKRIPDEFSGEVKLKYYSLINQFKWRDLS